MTIRDVLEVKAGTPVVDLKAHFVRAFERKTGVKDGKSWSLQNLQIQDDSHPDLLMVTVSNRAEDFSELGWEGRDIVLSATRNDGGAWRGLVAYDDEFKGQKQRKLRLSASGICRLADEAPAVASENRPPNGRRAHTFEEIFSLIVRVYPELIKLESDGQARAAIMNTLLIAITQGRIELEDWEYAF